MSDSLHRLLYITANTDVLNTDTEAYNRMQSYAAHTDELHIIVLGTREQKSPIQLAKNAWIYSTNTSVPPQLYITLRRIIRRQCVWDGVFRPEFIIATDTHASGVIARWIAKRYRRPYALEIRNRGAMQRRGVSLYSLLFATTPQRVTRNADSVVVASSTLKQEIQQYTNHSTVIPPHIDIAFIAQTPPTYSVKEQYSQFRFLMVCNSANMKRKDMRLALDVLKQCSRYVHNIGLLVLGDGIGRGYTRRIAERMNIADQVVYDAQPADVVSCYKTADVFLKVDSSDDIGTDLIEAFACGIPVVTTDVGVARDVLGDTQFERFICPIGDSACMAAHVRDLINENRLRNDFRFNAPAIAQERLAPNQSAYLARYQALWHDILTSGEDA